MQLFNLIYNEHETSYNNYNFNLKYSKYIFNSIYKNIINNNVFIFIFICYNFKVFYKSISETSY